MTATLAKTSIVLWFLAVWGMLICAAIDYFPIQPSVGLAIVVIGLALLASISFAHLVMETKTSDER